MNQYSPGHNDQMFKTAIASRLTKQVRHFENSNTGTQRQTKHHFYSIIQTIEQCPGGTMRLDHSAEI